MCWMMHSTKTIFPNFADDDIIVYKIGFKEDNEFIGYFYNEHYKIGEEKYHVDINLKRTYVYDDIKHYEINEGFHSYGNNARVNGLLKNCVIGRFIIPKGTKFFINDDKEYVSETIKFDGFEGKWPINTMSLSYCKILEILGLLENI